MTKAANQITDLAPTIHRQRLIVEGLVSAPIDDRSIKEYLTTLTGVMDMTLLLEPVTHRSPAYGWAGWVHWETSGAHFYAWEEPQLFFSADIYTCKPFSVAEVIEFTEGFFRSSVVYQEV